VAELIKPVAVILDGPQPPNGRTFCMVCIGFYKESVLNQPGVREKLERAERGDGPSRMNMIDLAPGVDLPELSVGMGISFTLNNQVSQLCWTHCMGIKVTNLLPGGNGSSGLAMPGR
jgi:hypothetical protein